MSAAIPFLIIAITALLFPSMGDAQQSGEAVIGTIPEAPAATIQAAQNHIISMVGKDYFEKNFTYYQSRENVTQTAEGDNSPPAKTYQVTFTYAIPHSHSTAAESVDVWLNTQNEIIFYAGPEQPYAFTITEIQAKEFARENGMDNPTDAEIVYGGKGFISDEGAVVIPYMWNVSSDHAEGGSPYVIYLDVEDGHVLGKWTQLENTPTIGDQSPDELIQEGNPQRATTSTGYTVEMGETSPLYFGILLVMMIGIGYFFLGKK